MNRKLFCFNITFTMSCAECSRLLTACKDAISASKQAIERYRGAVNDDAALAEQLVRTLRGRFIKTSDEFLEHVRHQHPDRKIPT